MLSSNEKDLLSTLYLINKGKISTIRLIIIKVNILTYMIIHDRIVYKTNYGVRSN